MRSPVIISRPTAAGEWATMASTTIPTTRQPAATRTAGYPGSGACHSRTERSEEHTSELQSLMRISYAVFCLKKKNNLNLQYHHRLLHPHTQRGLDLTPHLHKLLTPHMKFTFDHLTLVLIY